VSDVVGFQGDEGDLSADVGLEGDEPHTVAQLAFDDEEVVIGVVEAEEEGYMTVAVFARSDVDSFFQKVVRFAEEQDATFDGGDLEGGDVVAIPPAQTEGRRSPGHKPGHTRDDGDDGQGVGLGSLSSALRH
jgi:hypothetical protein